MAGEVVVAPGRRQCPGGVAATLLLDCLFAGTQGLPSRRLHPVYAGNEEKNEQGFCILHLGTLERPFQPLPTRMEN